MKKIFFLLAIFSLNFSSFGQNLSPYIQVGESTESMQQTYEKVLAALKDNSFTVLGAYNPAGKSTLKVIAFTRTDIKNTVVRVSDRGALAAAFKIGLVQKDNKIVISYTNPEYFLRAYLRNSYRGYQATFKKFDKDLRSALSPLGSQFTPFGGSEKADKLKDYHYKVMMPYFTDPVLLNEYASFEEGLQKIEDNLEKQNNNTSLVYKIVYRNEKVAVFGIGLKNKDKGEANFLPKIGESNVAAMPYEIILQGTKATMLHGKYRIALSWPQLSMGTFMRIMSTPDDIEDALKEVCK